ncbi:MAG: molybdenum cofactor biosynthesis protein MoaD [Mycobacterium sp.]|nr:molybdenum cofactor biosynthesis protein MoaD [Mycobacterium sp.]
MTHVQAEIKVNVRYFAAARAAAGMEEESLAVGEGDSVSDLVARLSARNRNLATVLERCSFLCDGFAVRNRFEPLRTNQTVDVLPPFAGG